MHCPSMGRLLGGARCASMLHRAEVRLARWGCTRHYASTMHPQHTHTHAHTDSRSSSFNDRKGMFCVLLQLHAMMQARIYQARAYRTSTTGSFSSSSFGDRRGSGFSDRSGYGDRGYGDRGYGESRGFDRYDSRGSGGGSFHDRRYGGPPDRRPPPDSPRGGRGQYGGYGMAVYFSLDGTNCKCSCI